MNIYIFSAGNHIKSKCKNININRFTYVCDNRILVKNILLLTYSCSLAVCRRLWSSLKVKNLTCNFIVPFSLEKPLFLTK